MLAAQLRNTILPIGPVLDTKGTFCANNASSYELWTQTLGTKIVHLLNIIKTT